MGCDMDKAQLFKRLYDMSMDELGLLVDHDETIQKSLYKLDMAARTRHIIEAVQIEDMFQSLGEDGVTFDLFLSMRLSPMTLKSCLDLNQDMNSLHWQFVFPKYDDIAADNKPQFFGEYLTHVQTLQILEIDNIDIDQACEFLDKAYDFTPHKTKPIIKRP
jgi:hypothetical protein